MPLISSTLLVSLVGVAQGVAAYLVLRDPSSFLSQNIILLLSGSMGMPHVLGSSIKLSAITALLAAAIAYAGLTDLVAVTLPREVYQIYWSVQAPVRAVFFFAVAVAAYILRPGPANALEATFSRSLHAPAEGQGLGNGIVFSWAFFGMLAWFWIWVTVRDEVREGTARARQKSD